MSLAHISTDRKMNCICIKFQKKYVFFRAPPESTEKLRFSHVLSNLLGLCVGGGCDKI